MMNRDLPRQKLREIVHLFGHQIADDPEKCERLLKDCCPEHRREIVALVSAIKEGLVRRLISTGREQPTNAIVRLLSKTLEEDIGLDSNLSRWAVESWGIALDLFSEEDLLSQTDKDSTIETPLNRVPPLMEPGVPSSLPDQKEPESIIDPVLKTPNRRKSRLKWAAGLLVIALFSSGGVFGYQKWRQKLEAEKMEEEALRQAEQAIKTAHEQIRQDTLKVKEERRQLEAKQEERRQVWAKEAERKSQLEQQRLEQIRVENQRRELELRERQERARLENQKRQQEFREKQEQARLENQRRQQEFLEKQRQLQADRQREAQERATQQQQQRVLQQGIDALKGVIK
jgi:hypothetical protein